MKIQQKSKIRRKFGFQTLSSSNLPNHKVSNCMLGAIGNLSMNRGATHWFHNIWSYGGEIIKY
jgi:hypothetical protein